MYYDVDMSPQSCAIVTLVTEHLALYERVTFWPLVWLSWQKKPSRKLKKGDKNFVEEEKSFIFIFEWIQ